MNVNFWTLLAPWLTRAPICLASLASHTSVVWASDAPQWTSSPKPCSLWPAAPARQVPDDAPHLPVDSCLQVALRVPAVTYKSFFSSPWVFMFCLLFGNLLLIQHIEQQWRTLPRIQVHGEPFSVSEFNSSAFNLIPCSSIWTKWIWAFKCFQQSLMSHFF